MGNSNYQSINFKKTGTPSMGAEASELVVFPQDSNYKVVKEICTDGIVEVPSSNKCSVENCDLDHSIIASLLDLDLENNNLRTEASNVVSSVPYESESSSESDCIKDVTEDYNLEAVFKEYNVGFGARVEAPEVSSYKKRILEAQRQASLDSNFERGDNKNEQVPGLPSSMLSSASNAIHNNTFASETAVKGDTETNGETRKTSLSSSGESKEHELSIAEKMAKIENEMPESLTKNSSNPIDPDHSMISTAYTRPLSCSDSVSFRSNSSSTSTRSFAFPVLPSEWYGSPVRMGEDGRRHMRKHRQWRSCFNCYRF